MLGSGENSYNIGIRGEQLQCWDHGRTATMLGSGENSYNDGIRGEQLQCWDQGKTATILGSGDKSCNAGKQNAGQAHIHFLSLIGMINIWIESTSYLGGTTETLPFCLELVLHYSDYL